MALSEVALAAIIAVVVLLIVLVVGFCTLQASSATTMSGFTPTCTVGVTCGSMPVIDPLPYPAGCVGCGSITGAEMNCCSSSEVPPVVE
jgi:hypothetical protein